MSKKTAAHFYYHLHAYARIHSPRVYDFVFQRKKIAKYLFSGGMATATNLLVLYVLTNFFGVYYLLSSIFAFIVSIGVSFNMQKFWAFEDSSKDDVQAQFILYSLVVLANLALNTVLVYALVQWLSIWYLLAQLLGGIVIAVVGFFAYRNVVFKA